MLLTAVCSPALFRCIQIGSSHTEINVESGAVLLIDNDRGADGWKDKKDFITASATYTNLAFTGNGVIDGQGQVWWQHRDDFRPRCLYVHGSNVYMENLTWKDCPNHNLEMYTDTTEINNITILAPPSTHVSNPSHNTDGIDVHGSPFYIHNTYINTGDDNVAFHANDTLVEDCVFGTGHGASVGSIGTGTWIQNITVRNVQFKGTTTACRIKTDHGADGAVRDITYDSLTMEGVGTTIDVNMFYSAVGAHSSGGSMTISHITFSNIKADKSGSPGEFNCGDGGCDDILLDNVVRVHTASNISLAIPRRLTSLRVHSVVSTLVGSSNRFTLQRQESGSARMPRGLRKATSRLHRVSA